MVRNRRWYCKVEWLCRLKSNDSADPDIFTSEKAGQDRSANLSNGININAAQTQGINRNISNGGKDDGLEKVTS